ncbi:protein of unknown function [Magnetospira sp. QH-2]|nr:protein of unknown function [Magnetospira sp. QH-2]
MSKDDSPETSTDGPSKSEDELWAEKWLAEWTKPSRQRNLTPSQRKELAETLWASRHPRSKGLGVRHRTTGSPSNPPKSK